MEKVINFYSEKVLEPAENQDKSGDFTTLVTTHLPVKLRRYVKIYAGCGHNQIKGKMPKKPENKGFFGTYEGI